MYVSVCVFPEAQQRREVQPSYYKTTNYGSPQPENLLCWGLINGTMKTSLLKPNASTLEKCRNLKFNSNSSPDPRETTILWANISIMNKKRKASLSVKAFFICVCRRCRRCFLIYCETHRASLSHLSLPAASQVR